MSIELRAVGVQRTAVPHFHIHFPLSTGLGLAAVAGLFARSNVEVGEGQCTAGSPEVGSLPQGELEKDGQDNQTSPYSKMADPVQFAAGATPYLVWYGRKAKISSSKLVLRLVEIGQQER